jgi:hypothetical protein
MEDLKTENARLIKRVTALEGQTAALLYSGAHHHQDCVSRPYPVVVCSNALRIVYLDT